ncbi:DUF1232 domain-containing protein [Streptomyces sp. MB22_4]
MPLDLVPDFFPVLGYVHIYADNAHRQGSARHRPPGG